MSASVAAATARADEKHAAAAAVELQRPLPAQADAKAPPGEHMLTVEEACKRFDTDVRRGLRKEQVGARLARDGPNVLSPPKQLSLPMKFARELFSGFAGILWVASLLAFLAWKPLGEPNPDPGNLTLGIVLLFVIVAQATFNFWQEFQSARVLESFRALLSTRAIVTRDGKQTEIDAAGLVVGDVVKVAMGQNAPADLLLFRVNALKLDKAAITGESDPVEATTAPPPGAANMALVEASNLVLLGTRVVEGDGAGVVIRVGDQCAVASVVRMASIDSAQTTLHKEVSFFVKIIVAAALTVAVAGAITWGAWLNPRYGDDSPGATKDGGAPFLTVPQLLANLIGMIVAFVPEGLPISVTMTLSLIAYRLVQRYKVVVTKLGTVETLGAVSLVASDKTGTITCNQMTLRRLVTAGRSYDYTVAAEDMASARSEIVTRHLIRDAVLCNAVDVAPENLNDRTISVNSRSQLAAIAKIENETTGTRFAHLSAPPKTGALRLQGGNPLDRALMHFAETRVNVRATRDAYPRVIEMPFNSATKIMISVHRKPRASVVAPPLPLPGTAGAQSATAAFVGAAGVEVKTEEPKSAGVEDPTYVHPTLAPPTIHIAGARLTPAVAPAVAAPAAPAGAVPKVSAGFHGSSHYVAILKGAPEYVIGRCATVLMEKPSATAGAAMAMEEVELTPARADELLRQAERFGGNGERLVAVAERVLPAEEYGVDFGFRTNPPNFPTERLCLVGLCAVMDPPREDVAQAVTDCQQAGIQVCMITGDHPSTAQAIARMVGIIRSAPEKVLTWAEAKRVPLPFGVDSNGSPITPDCACCGAACECCPTGCTSCWARCTEPVSRAYDAVTCDDCNNCPCAAEDAAAHAAQKAEAESLAASLSITSPAPAHRKTNRLQTLALVVTGTELRDFTAEDWARVFRFEQLVFARTTPDQKLKIVTMAQSVGHVVAVTGDGVNDAPALRKANVGVAMGSATDVAQASADMVVRNNDFASIVRGIEQGRVVYDNLKKVISYLLPAGSFSELMPVVVTIWFGAPTALSGFLMVIICIFTDVFASLALVHEPAESDLMSRAPRDPSRSRLVDWKLILYAYGFIGVLESFAAFLIFGLYLRANAPQAIADAINASGGVDGQPVDPQPFGPADWLLTFNEGAYSLPAETLFTGQSIFFVTLVLCQIGNLMTTRTRVVPIIPMRWFGLESKIHAHAQQALAPAAAGAAGAGMVMVQAVPSPEAAAVASAQVLARRDSRGGDDSDSRWVPIVVACAASILTAVLITEGQWVNVRPVPVQYWAAGALAGVCIFLCGEARKFWFNVYPDGLVAKLAW